MKDKKKFVKLNLADFIDYSNHQFDDHYFENYDDDNDDHEHDHNNDIDDNDDFQLNNLGIVKYKNKFIVKNGASSQNYFDAEAQDFQYKNKKKIESDEFEKEYQKQLNIFDDDNNYDDYDDYDFFIGGTNFNYYLPYEYIFNINIQTRNVGNNTVIHTFEQNSHDQNINSSLQESISKINTFINWNSCIDDAIKYFGVEFVNKYMNWNEIQIQNIYGKIWSRILSYDTQIKNEAIKILKSEIINGYGKCLTGRINRIISSLCGIDIDIQQKISLSQQFTLIFDALHQKYSNIDIFSNEFIDLFKKECFERNIDNYEVELYIKSIN
jgi:hypothetical protein